MSRKISTEVLRWLRTLPTMFAVRSSRMTCADCYAQGCRAFSKSTKAAGGPPLIQQYIAGAPSFRSRIVRG